MMKIAIIGGGLAGLTAAFFLKNHAEVTVFEKSRGVGGRSSTRRGDGYFFDHGAPYFLAEETSFQHFLEPLIASGSVQPWQARYARFDGHRIIKRNDLPNEKRYVAVPGMNSLAQFLASPINVAKNTKIVSLARDIKWTVVDEREHCYTDFDWVVIAIPAPQIAELLTFDYSSKQIIESVRMSPCFSFMLGVNDVFDAGFDCAHIDYSAVRLLSFNHSKPGRGGPMSIVIQSSADYAQKNMQTESHIVREEMKAELEQLIQRKLSHIQYESLHLWRYAVATTPQPCGVLIEPDKQLVFGGDWSYNRGIEGAFLAGREIAAQIEQYCSR